MIPPEFYSYVHLMKGTFCQSENGLRTVETNPVWHSRNNPKRGLCRKYYTRSQFEGGVHFMRNVLAHAGRNVVAV
jgi:hypothetical protein